MAAQQQQYPNLSPYGNSNDNTQRAQDAKNSIRASKAAMDNIANSQTVQSLQNGPVADKARQETQQVKNEFSDLANSRQTPQTQTATGQPLTHYHSALYNLLSWKNPRATGISYAAIVVLIFAFRYVPMTRYALRLTWITLGITAAAEVAGRLVMDAGLASRFRPKKYYTVPRETLESFLSDVEQLINFFVIEAQRVLFAENVYVTIAVFFSTLLTYFLIKITPAWGLALLFTTLIYFTPLIYITNQEFIDGHIKNASDIIGQQTQQMRDLAAHHTNRAMEATSAAMKDASVKAQEMIGQTKQKAVEKGIVSQETADKTEQSLKQAPNVPQDDPASQQAVHGTAEPVTAPVAAQ